MARVKNEHSNWIPWGGFDDLESFPQISEKAAAAAIQRFEITEDQKIAHLQSQLWSITRYYLRAKRELAAPPSSWYDGHVKPLLTATEALLKIIKKPVKGSGRTFLKWRIQGRMHRPLMGLPTDPESLEQILEQFRSACRDCLRKTKGKPGAKKQSHIEEAVQDLSKLWEELSGKPVPMSLDSEVHGLKQEFVSRGPRFCQVVLQGIDPDVSTSQIETALRKIRAKSTKDGSVPRGKARKSPRKKDQPQSADVIKESEQSGTKGARKTPAE